MIDYSALAFPKGRPRVAVKRAAKKDLAAEERACRAKVDKRDKRRCFFPKCKAYAGEKHHIVASSVRGKREWATNDILSSCTEHHRWFKAGLITVKGNPDRGPVQVAVTALGAKESIVVPPRS